MLGDESWGDWHCCCYVAGKALQDVYDNAYKTPCILYVFLGFPLNPWSGFKHFGLKEKFLDSKSESIFDSNSELLETSQDISKNPAEENLNNENKEDKNSETII